MNTRERTRAKADNARAAQFTELWIIGTPEDVSAIVHQASASGLLVYASAPERVSREDPRFRRYLRLRTAPK
ncbi:hypothetical protein [Polymorphospora rubra]|uniref:hypothetical protein n=1 Tax=Polymorphospora rubra TaxID=338584 RepID=UPI0033F1CE95